MGNRSGATRHNAFEPRAQAPHGQLGTKRMGELAELAFMYKAASLDFGVAKPYGDSRPYDFLLQHGSRVLRIQVKSVFTTNRGEKRFCYSVNVFQTHYKKGIAHYSANDIDFIAAFVAPHNAWYLIPIESLSTRKSIHLYPAGKKKRTAGLFEHYREAWHLLKDQAEPDG